MGGMCLELPFGAVISPVSGISIGYGENVSIVASVSGERVFYKSHSTRRGVANAHLNSRVRILFLLFVFLRSDFARRARALKFAIYDNVITWRMVTTKQIIPRTVYL